MNIKNINIVNFIDKREQLQRFYQKNYKVLDKVGRGILTVFILTILGQIFPCGAMSHRLLVIVGAALVQAFLPKSVLYYISSAFVMYSLWTFSKEACLMFLVFWVMCLLGYLRVNSRHMYLAMLIPVLFYCKIGFLAPVVLALLVGYEALFPTAIGIITYYIALTLKEGQALFTTAGSSSDGVIHVVTQLFKNKEMFVMIAAAVVVILVTCVIAGIFYEKARFLALIIGNVLMASLLLLGKMYCGFDVAVWHILIEMLAGILLCIAVEFNKGFVDISRTEKTIFEDDEYIYYVKAVPKIKMAKSEPNITVINETEHEGEDTDESGTIS